MKVLSNTNKDNELAWIKLFSFFRDVQDEQRKIQVIEIKRQSVRALVDDILRCLRKKELSNDLHVLVLPWYYDIHDFMTESQKVDHAWQKATIVENEKRLNELETKIEAKLEKKHAGLIYISLNL